MLSRLSPLLRHSLARGLSREALLAMEPEAAHQATLLALRLGLVPEPALPDPPELRTRLAGLELQNPIGMAAGFDKNAEVAEALGRAGFGMVETGTVTPLPQEGNPKPRVFRIPEAGGIVNRLGFNNVGHERACENLSRQRATAVVGVNIGANKGSADFVADYVRGVERFAGAADYLTVNVSSPNTPGLRDLQAGEALRRLLGEVLAARARRPVRVPVLLKLAPDLDEAGLDAVAAVVARTDLDGLIVSNTTISRAGVERMTHGAEPGGLSGRPLFALSTRRLAQMRQRVGPALPILGVGGVHSARSAVHKFEAGADAIQLYSALVYGGLELVEEIKAGLARAVRDAGGRTVADLRDRALDDWAAGRVEG